MEKYKDTSIRPVTGFQLAWAEMEAKEEAEARRSAADCSQSELSAMLEIAVQLREILWCDANSMVQGGMVGCPVECFAFAKWWIMRAKGIPTDVPGGYPVFSQNAERIRVANNTEKS